MPLVCSCVIVVVLVCEGVYCFNHCLSLNSNKLHSSDAGSKDTPACHVGVEDVWDSVRWHCRYQVSSISLLRLRFSFLVRVASRTLPLLLGSVESTDGNLFLVMGVRGFVVDTLICFRFRILSIRGQEHLFFGSDDLSIR